MPIEHINKTDTLNEGRVKLNAAIDGANAADVTSKEADTKATQALANSESTQTQLDTIVIDGDSSVEAAQARVDEKGVPHPTLKARIDDGMNSVNQQLAQTVTIDKLNNSGVDIEDFSSFVVDDDWSPAFEEALSISHKIFIGDVELGISRPITTDGRIELVGSGKSEIKALNKMTYMLDITNTDYVDVSGIFFNGEDTTSRGVRVANSRKSNFINCRFENFHSDMNDSVRVFLIDRYNVDNLSITKCIFKNLYAEPNNIVGDDTGVCRAIDISSGSGSIAQLSKNIIIDACSFEEIHTVEDADAIGIIFASDMLPIDVTISNCRFHNVAKRAVKAQASNIKMTNNVVTMDYDEEQL